MASAHHWTSPIQVAGHHLARALVAMGWDVAFISNPISPLHVGRGISPQLLERFTIWRGGGVGDLGGHLWAYVPVAALSPTGAPGLRSRAVHRGWHRLTVPNVVREVRRRGFGSVDVLYFDSVVQRFWMDAIDHRASVLRISDAMTGFEGFTAEMDAMETDLARRVDLVVYTASTLEPRVRKRRPRRSIHLPNGVNASHFLSDRSPVPADLAMIPRPIAIYIGALDHWFDFETLGYTVKALPAVSFVLIGPDGAARRRLASAPNLHLLGPRPYRDLPAYLRHADVGLIPFDARGQPELVNSIHPLKLYEYLAAGLPVVATEWEELARLGSPAILCRTTDQFVAAIQRAIDEPTDRSAGVAFAAAADWAGRAQSLLAALDIRASV